MTNKTTKPDESKELGGRVDVVVSLTVDELANHLGCAAARARGLRGDDMARYMKMHKSIFLATANAIADKAG